MSCEDTHTQRGDGHVKTGGDGSDAATSQGRPGAPRSANRREGSSLEPPEGAWPCPQLDFAVD